ncbi:MAG: RHS repeat-associated core domain-containing protein, partial [Nitrosomonadales bacterium]|nr:RHS repeat-associated core domain-containing protein [Nitrosomonadales bacterium]
YLKDHLGSITAQINGDPNPAVLPNGTTNPQAGRYAIQYLSYDIWGKQRYPNGTADPTGQLNNPDMYHGYTGHEMLDDVGLIHMNGRLYDPVMARFVSADMHIQSPDNLQSYNRYSYVWNNPLNSTDPSGYFRLFGINITPRLVIAVAVAWYVGPMISNSLFSSVMGSALTSGAAITTGQVMATYAVTSAIGGAAAGFASSMVMTGGNVDASLNGALTGAIFGAANAASVNMSSFSRGMVNAFAGGIASRVQGQSFGTGFRHSALQHLLFEGYKQMEKITNNYAARAGTNDVRDPISGQLRTDGTLPCLGDCSSLTARVGMSPQGMPGHFYEDIGIVRTFVNAVSKVHDVMNAWGYGSMNGQYGFVGGGVFYNTAFDALWSMPMMLTAASVTVLSIDQSGVILTSKNRR